MRFSIDVGDPLKHKKALGVMVDAPLSENTSRIGLNYKLDPGIFSVSLIQRLRAITSLMKDPEVDIEAFGLDDENLRRQLSYKGDWYSCQIVPVDRFFPSSKTCSVCGLVNENLTLSDREWTCECGVHHDRDHNAAVNLENVAASLSET